LIVHLGVLTPLASTTIIHRTCSFNGICAHSAAHGAGSAEAAARVAAVVREERCVGLETAWMHDWTFPPLIDAILS